MADKAIKVVGVKMTYEGASEYQKTTKELNQEISSTFSTLKKQNEEFKKTDKESEKLARRQEALTKVVSAQEKAVETLKEAYSRESKQRKLSTEEISKMEQGIEKAETKLLSFKNQLNDTTDAQKENEMGMGNLGKAYNDNAEKMQKTGEGMMIVGAVGAAAIGGSIAVASDLDEAWDSIAKRTGATGDAMIDLQNVAKDVFSTIQIEPQETADAISGLNTIFGVTGGTLRDMTIDFKKFADVNEVDVGSAVDTVGKMMKDAQIPAEEYTSVLDMLTSAQQNGAIDAVALADAVTKNGATMRAMGYDTEETITMLAAFEKAGVNTEGMLAGLKKANANWAKEGKNSREEFEKLIEAVKQGDTTQAFDMFGAKNAQEFIDAIKTGKFEYEDMVTAISGSSGTLSATYDEIAGPQEEAAVAMQNLKLATGEIGDMFITTLAPALAPIIEALKQFATWLKDSDPWVKNLIVGLGLFAVALLPLGFLLTVLPAIAAGFTLLTATILPAIGAAFLVAAPFIAIGVAIAGVIGFLFLLRENFELIMGLFGSLKDVLSNAFGGFGEILYSMFIQPIENIFTSVMGIFDGLINFVVGVFTGNWEQAWNGVVGVFGGIWDLLKTIVLAPLNFIIGGINLLIEGLNHISFDIPEWVPGIGGSKFGINIPKIPMLADGAVLNQATLAIAGEAGKELVVPVTNNNLAGEVASFVMQGLEQIGGLGGNSGGQPMTVNIILDGKTLGTELIPTINEQNTQTMQLASRSFVYGK